MLKIINPHFVNNCLQLPLTLETSIFVIKMKTLPTKFCQFLNTVNLLSFIYVKY